MIKANQYQKKIDFYNPALVFLYFCIAGAIIYRKLYLQDGIWAVGDGQYPWAPYMLQKLKNLSLYTWNDEAFGGYDSISQGLVRSFYYVIYRLLIWLFGFSNCQYAWNILMFGLGGLFSFLMTDHFSNNKRVSLIASILFMLNPWMVERSRTHYHFYMAQIFSPLVIYSYSSYLRTGKIHFTIFFGLGFFGIMWSLYHQIYLFVIMLMFFLYSFSYADVRKNVGIFLKRNIVFSSIVLLILAVYLLPMTTSFFHTLERAEGFLDKKPYFFYGGKSTLINALRFLGFWDSVYMQENVNINFKLIVNLFLFAIPIMVIISAFIKDSTHQEGKKYFFLLLIVAVLIACAPNIFGDSLIYQKLLLKIPIFALLFSIPDPNISTAVIVIAACPLFAFSYNAIFSYTENKFKSKKTLLNVSSYAVMIIYAIIISYPLVNFNNDSYKFFKIPEYYKKISSIVNNDPQFNHVFVSPPAMLLKYNWSPYLVANLTYIFNKPVIGQIAQEHTPKNTTDFTSIIIEKITSHDVNTEDYLGMNGVKYVLTLGDLNESVHHRSIEEVKTVTGSLEKYSNTEKLFNHEDVSLFKIDSDKVNSIIYSPKRVSLVDQNFYRLIPNMNLPSLLKESAFIMMKDQNIEFKKILKGLFSSNTYGDGVIVEARPGEDSLIVKRVNPAKYIVDVNHNELPYFIIFSESYHENWNTYIRKKPLSEKEPWLAIWGLLTEDRELVPSKNHFIANGFSNGWLIMPKHKDIPDIRYQLVIEYQSQYFLEIGAIITFFTTFVLFIISVKNVSKCRRYKMC
jgi:hypothetical protein